MTQIHSVSTPDRKNPFFSDVALLLYLAGFKVLLHIITNSVEGYGYFRDELYYLACSEHLDLGYVDQPPFSLYILAFSRLIFGDSLVALRLLPALAGGATVFVSGLIARELGGRRWSQLMAALASVVSLIFLAMFNFYSMNCYDILLWSLSFLILARWLKTQEVRLWLILGVVLGLGLLNKTGVAWLGFGIFVALLVTPHRKWLATRWPWIAFAIACLIALPYLVWNAFHDLAHLEFIQNATASKYAGLNVWTFLLVMIPINNPMTLPLWVGGLYFLLFSKPGKEFRFLGITVVVIALILIINQRSKSEYFSPAFTLLFAGGSVLFERIFSESRWRMLRIVLPVFVGAGILLAPITLPILPVDTYIAYQNALGIEPTTSEQKELSELPQYYADMFGWEEKAGSVAKAYLALSPQDQAKCAIYADNYGRCAAIDFFGRKLGLPGAIGRHNNYWIWGPRNFTGELVMVLGGDLEDKKEIFESVEIVGETSCRYCMPYENHLKIYLCRNLKSPVAELWKRLKNYD
jgi:hypothetical protein